MIMYYECPVCGDQLHNAFCWIGWECLGGDNGKPQHPPVGMREVFPDPPPRPNTPEQDDLQAIVEIMDRHGWTRVDRGSRGASAVLPWVMLRRPK